MTNRTSRRTIRLLASTGILGLALTIAPVGLDLSLDAFKISPVQALAESGSDSDGDGGSDSSGSGSDGDGGSDSSGSGSGGDDDDHDNSGPGSANSSGDHDNSGPGSANSGRRGGQANTGGDDGQRPIRPEITLDLSADDLNDVMAGRKVLVDDLGRTLEVEIELEHGSRTVIAKPHGGDSRRNPGPITSFSLVDAGGVMTTPGDDDGTPDQGPGDN